MARDCMLAIRLASVLINIVFPNISLKVASLIQAHLLTLAQAEQ